MPKPPTVIDEDELPRRVSRGNPVSKRQTIINEHVADYIDVLLEQVGEDNPPRLRFAYDAEEDPEFRVTFSRRYNATDRCRAWFRIALKAALEEAGRGDVIYRDYDAVFTYNLRDANDGSVVVEGFTANVKWVGRDGQRPGTFRK